MRPLALVNGALRHFGLQLSRHATRPRFPPETAARLRDQLAQARTACPQFTVIEALRDESQPHPASRVDLECEFASEQIARHRPAAILDVGSYRHWLIGVMAHYRVTTVDVRVRSSGLSNETPVTGDVCALDLPAGSVDMVTSLCTLEHVGLGRYGDPFDLAADRKAFAALIRVIRPGGHLVFSVPITTGRACLAFNSHRIYTRAMIGELTVGLVCREERFIKEKPARFCDLAEVSAILGAHDVYCGCYEKP